MAGPELRDQNGIRWVYGTNGKLRPEDPNVIVPNPTIQAIFWLIGLVTLGVVMFIIIMKVL